MYDAFLYSKEITVPLIIKKVSEVTQVSVTDMTVPDRYGNTRKREFVCARQISMALSKKYTNLSLAKIGSFHGGRDHATTLHACKIISNMIETHDPYITTAYFKLDDMLSQIRKKQIKSLAANKEYFARFDIVKTFIRLKINLYDRQRILGELNYFTYDKYKLATLSVRVQKVN